MKKQLLILISFLLCFLICNFISSINFVKAEGMNNVFDSYIIELSGTGLNTATGLNLTLSFVGGTAQLDSGVTLKANGASQLLTDVNSTTGIVTVVWTGAIKDGKATISGKIKSGSLSGNPVLNVTKLEASGGVDITSTTKVAITTFDSAVKVEEPSEKDEPTPTPAATVTPTPEEEEGDNEDDISEEDEATISLTGPETVTVKKTRINAIKLKAHVENIDSVIKCTLSTSDSSLGRIRPAKILFSPSRRDKTLILRVPFNTVKQLIEEEEEDILTVSVECNNDIQEEIDILITPFAE